MEKNKKTKKIFSWFILSTKERKFVAFDLKFRKILLKITKWQQKVNV